MKGATLILDIGGTRIRIGHLRAGRPHPELAAHPTEDLRRAEPLAHLDRLIRAYAEQRSLAPEAVVIGVPFTPDRELSTALSSPNIPNLEGVPIRDGLAQRLGVPVRLERDINLLLLGEWRAGAARGSRDVFGMFVGTGVGGAFLQQGVPFRGASGGAVELGHVPIRGEGRRCVCGNVDCLEAYACGHTLRALADRHGMPVERVFAERREGEAADELAEFVRDLAYALATAVNLLQPDSAVVGGGIPAMAGFPREPFEEIFYGHLRRPLPATSVRLAWAELGSLAALHGAVEATVHHRNEVSDERPNA